MTDVYAHHTPASHDPMEPHPHTMSLFSLFVALLALTAAEVIIFEVWHRTSLHETIPKFAIVIIILLFTLPKAALVLIYFMHLKFERQLIVLLALIPFVTAAIAILIPTTDNQTLQHQDKMRNFVPTLKAFSPNDNEVKHAEAEHMEADHAPAAAPTTTPAPE